MTPTIGRIVLYTLSENDCVVINRRRTTASSIADLILDGKWPLGAQAHIGPEVRFGDTFPMIIVKATAYNSFNGQVLLDGTDNYWAQDKYGGNEPVAGQWHWPIST